MTDRRQVLGILKAARALISDEKDWTSDGVMCDAQGRVCALGALARVIGFPERNMDEGDAYDALENDPAVAALIVASPISDASEPMEAVWRLNDRGHHGQVLGLFDKAISNVEAEIVMDAILPELTDAGSWSTPNADAALAVLEACETAGGVVARGIVSQRPDLDFEEVANVAASELFYAAQDTARACDLGVGLVRS